ncbi:RNA-binding protein [Pseudohyphozyma bogoriensis]|nr:RNA-binding protein [Pseudohyphozyma bogoriensis]
MNTSHMLGPHLTHPFLVPTCWVRDVVDAKKQLVRNRADVWLVGREFPCLSVQLVGMIVGVTEKEEKLTYILDDSTALIDVQIHRPAPAPLPALPHLFPKLPSSPSKPSVTPTPAPSESLYALPVGTLVRVVGRIDTNFFTKKPYLVVSTLFPLTSFNDEAMHHSLVARLHCEVYDREVDLDALITRVEEEIEDRRLLEASWEDCSVANLSQSSASSSRPGSPRKKKKRVKLDHPNRLTADRLTIHELKTYILHTLRAKVPSLPTADSPPSSPRRSSSNHSDSSGPWALKEALPERPERSLSTLSDLDATRQTPFTLDTLLSSKTLSILSEPANRRSKSRVEGEAPWALKPPPSSSPHARASYDIVDLTMEESEEEGETPRRKREDEHPEDRLETSEKTPRASVKQRSSRPTSDSTTPVQPPSRASSTCRPEGFLLVTHELLLSRLLPFLPNPYEVGVDQSMLRTKLSKDERWALVAAKNGEFEKALLLGLRGCMWLDVAPPTPAKIVNQPAVVVTKDGDAAPASADDAAKKNEQKHAANDSDGEDWITVEQPTKAKSVHHNQHHHRQHSHHHRDRDSSSSSTSRTDKKRQPASAHKQGATLAPPSASTPAPSAASSSSSNWASSTSADALPSPTFGPTPLPSLGEEENSPAAADSPAPPAASTEPADVEKKEAAPAPAPAVPAPPPVNVWAVRKAQLAAAAKANPPPPSPVTATPTPTPSQSKKTNSSQKSASQASQNGGSKKSSVAPASAGASGSSSQKSKQPKSSSSTVPPTPKSPKSRGGEMMGMQMGGPGMVQGPYLDPTRYWLLGQIEYYFSIDNLCRDLFLRGAMDSLGFLPISLIASFARVKALSTDYALIRSTMLLTPLLEVVGEFVRMRNGWKEWVLPTAKPSTVVVAPEGAQHHAEEGESEEDEGTMRTGSSEATTVAGEDEDEKVVSAKGSEETPTLASVALPVA